jgi:hypothetical protein
MCSENHCLLLNIQETYAQHNNSHLITLKIITHKKSIGHKILWEPPTRQTDYSCLYQKVGDIYTHG